MCTTSVTQLKGFKLKLSEALGFHGLTAKLVEDEMNDKGHNRASEEKLVKVKRDRDRKRERERGGGSAEVMWKGSCTGKGRRGERGSGGLGRYYISCIEG